MTKTLILHIGHFKTGTTALQVFFDKATRFLKKNDLQYPAVWQHNSKHSAFAFSILRAAGVEKLMYNYSDPTPPGAMWDELFAAAMSAKVNRTLISSEEFMRVGQFPAAVETLSQVLKRRPEGLEIKAIVYLRDPASHLHSWYNQLIKMNFPLSDMNAAVDGDIENIHFDYHRALAPWIELLGQENVHIRPYVFDRANPAALHEDFFRILDIDLPAGIVGGQQDPNPRLDDRVIELVRLMQNMELPRPTIAAIRTRALAYLETQDKLRLGAANGMDAARAQASAGVDWLAGLADSALPIEDFARQLPEPMDQNASESTLLLGFVLSELVQLRQRVNNANLSDLTARVAALEERLARQKDI